MSTEQTTEVKQTAPEVKTPTPVIEAGRPGLSIRDITPKDAQTSTGTLHFNFAYNSPVDKVIYSGDFIVKRSTIGGAIQVDRVRASMTGGEFVTEDTNFMCHMIAYCQVHLTKAPEWWKPTEFYDAMILRHVYDHVRAWQDSFRASVEK